jgi:hypothetical protein
MYLRFLEQPVPGDEQRNGGGPHQVLLPPPHPTRGAGHQGDQHHNIQVSVSVYYGISLSTQSHNLQNSKAVELPDPWIRTSELPAWLRILRFLSVTFKAATKIFFF